MKYRMKVNLVYPFDDGERPKEVFLDLTATFGYDPEQYGNGNYVCIKGDGFNKESYDIRYDRSFRRDRKEEWLENWARSYWNGKDGAYIVKRIKIEKI